MKTVLLHICCGVCALGAIERLKEQEDEVYGLFFNPNISPDEEYEKRKIAVKAAGEIAAVKIIEGRRDSEAWSAVCQKYRHEKEGQARCILCYELRLKETFRICVENNFDWFTTTLTISPHKNSKTIISLGRELGGDKFLAVDFKKKDGFKRTIELAKKHNLYRQNYCGCLFSRQLSVVSI